jgi:Ser/Thr protein kinase RdoA (MazF antagonist)
MLSSEQWEATGALQRALAQYGLTGFVASKTPQSPGYQQRAHVWQIISGPRRLVAKRYHAWLADDAIRYEHSVLGHLSARRFPVAAPLPAPGGATWLLSEGARWALYPALDGAHLDAQLWNFNLGQAAEMLARLHLELKDFVPQGAPHPAWSALTLEQLDARVARWPALPGLTPELLAAVRDRLAAGYFATTAGGLPQTIVHGEFTTANVLWENGAISGVLDFERAHRGVALWDLATGLWTRFPPVLRAVVALYGRVWPLSLAEREAIPDAILLGSLMGIEAQLGVYKNPTEAARRVQDLAFSMRDLEQLRKAAGAIPR